MSELENLEKRSAQALLATYLQMTRYAELARSLQQARERSIERRMKNAIEMEEVVRLQRQLDAQQGQGAAIGGALERFQSRAPELASFAEAGLTYQDFVDLGLENVVKQEDVEEAIARAKEAKAAKAQQGEAQAVEGTPPAPADGTAVDTTDPPSKDSDPE